MHGVNGQHTGADLAHDQSFKACCPLIRCGITDREGRAFFNGIKELAQFLPPHFKPAGMGVLGPVICVITHHGRAIMQKPPQAGTARATDLRELLRNNQRFSRGVKQVGGHGNLLQSTTFLRDLRLLHRQPAVTGFGLAQLADVQAAQKQGKYRNNSSKLKALAAALVCKAAKIVFWGDNKQNPALRITR